MRAAVGEQVLGVALFVVQRTQQHAGPPQLSGGDGSGPVPGVVAELSRQQQELTILTELLLVEREGDELPEPEERFRRVVVLFNLIKFY